MSTKVCISVNDQKLLQHELILVREKHVLGWRPFEDFFFFFFFQLVRQKITGKES